jgi:HlyD family secretion protein
MVLASMSFSRRARVLSLASLPVLLAGIAYAIVTLKPLPVHVAHIVEDAPVRVGTVEARVISKTGFEVGARITELNADHGDFVKQGQVLARLHAAQQEAKVARATATELSAEVAVKKAEANLEKARAILAQRLEVNRRRQELVSRKVTSEQAGEEAQRDADVAKADVLVAESDIEVAKAQLADARAQLALREGNPRTSHAGRV